MPVLDQMLKEQNEQGTNWTPSKVSRSSVSLSARTAHSLPTWPKLGGGLHSWHGLPVSLLPLAADAPTLWRGHQ